METIENKKLYKRLKLRLFLKLMLHGIIVTFAGFGIWKFMSVVMGENTNTFDHPSKAIIGLIITYIIITLMMWLTTYRHLFHKLHYMRNNGKPPSYREATKRLGLRINKNY